HSAEEIARLETEIWNGLKLSGELNRTKRDGKWILHFNSERALREDGFKKIKAFETALEVKLREMVENDMDGRRFAQLLKKLHELDLNIDFLAEKYGGGEQR
ncbi:MAG: hypothetical protein QHH02_04755, partial [Syntrophomonadaceae bacterium]|nr:hypothetical protein [Syntrophomonadaceae bacterium]